MKEVYSLLGAISPKVEVKKRKGVHVAPLVDKKASSDLILIDEIAAYQMFMRRFASELSKAHTFYDKT